ncbi:MAG TPA: hypothetical protein VMT19_13545 [Thermoanaerobaculaceae bacterium]|nr:hypothetical protein [Thermoanaerobaculaceae bacterium]
MFDHHILHRRSAYERARRRTDGGTGASAAVARIMDAACVALLLASAGVAGEAPAPKRSGFHAGIGIMVASGLGSVSSDLNNHPGFGLAFQGYLTVASRFQVRPAFEWTGYRVNEYNLASRLLADVLDAEYRDTRVVFRTYRFGVDGVLYFRDGYRGPFVSGGVGVQLSRVYIEDVMWHGTDQEEVVPLGASSSTTGLWLGGGAGYRSGSTSLELRLSRAPYRYTTARPPDRPPNSLGFEPKQGWALHLIMAVDI